MKVRIIGWLKEEGLSALAIFAVLAVCLSSYMVQLGRVASGHAACSAVPAVSSSHPDCSIPITMQDPDSGARYHYASMTALELSQLKQD
jgi:hypothetical protein